MNIVESFSQYLEDEMSLTLGTDLFIGSAPVDKDDVWWIFSGGGGNVVKNDTGEKRKNYIVNAYYRGLDAQDVYNKLEQLETLVNSATCPQLNGYDTIEIETVTFPTDQDIDAQDRTIGLIQITITTYT